MRKGCRDCGSPFIMLCEDRRRALCEDRRRALRVAVTRRARHGKNADAILNLFVLEFILQTRLT